MHPRFARRCSGHQRTGNSVLQVQGSGKLARDHRQFGRQCSCASLVCGRRGKSHLTTPHSGSHHMATTVKNRTMPLIALGLQQCCIKTEAGYFEHCR